MGALFDKLFRDRDALVRGRTSRWIVVVFALAFGAFLAVAPSGQDEQLNRFAGVALLALGALAVLYALLCEYLIAHAGRLSPEEWDRQEADRRVREGVEQAAKLRALYGLGNADSPSGA